VIILQLSNTTARRLSYLIGHSDEANIVVEAAMSAAKIAEQNVRDVIKLVADQSGNTLPETYSVEFKDDVNEIHITPKDNLVRMNGHE
jgi:hypothetical protein